MTNIDPTVATKANPFEATKPSGATAAPNNALGKDAFLQLLVAQLKYQNPMEPTDASQFMAQTAQFTMVEKLEEIARSTAATQLDSQSLTAASLVGREISYLGEDGAETKGTVSAARLGSAGPVLTVDGKSVPLAVVTEVRHHTTA